MEASYEDQPGTREGLVVSIMGEKVALGPIRRDLVPLYHRWINDFAVLRTLHVPRPSTLEEVQAAHEAQVAEERQRRVVHFTVYDRATLRPVGRTDLMDISYRDRSARFGIEIGRPIIGGGATGRRPRA